MSDDPRALLDVYSDAAYARDVDRFMTMYADEEVRIFDLWNTWEFVGASAWRESIAGWFASLGDERVVVEFADVQVSDGANVAAISAIVTYSGESASGERARQMQNRLTWVVSRKADGWRVIHEHTSAPVDDAFGKVILTRE